MGIQIPNSNNQNPFQGKNPFGVNSGIQNSQPKTQIPLVPPTNNISSVPPVPSQNNIFTTPKPQTSTVNSNITNSKSQTDSAIVMDIKEQETIIEDVQESQKIMDQINDYLLNFSSIKLDEKLLFFQLLGSMIGAGLPIIDALNLLINQTKNMKFKKVIIDIRTQIEEGESLATSMRANDDVFDEATCAVIEAGEKSGKLNEIFKELVTQYEQLSTITKKIKSIMTYPLVVLVVMGLLTVVVLVFVVPKLEELFGGAANLPLPTRILINASAFVFNHWFLLIIGVFGTISGFLWWKKTDSGKKTWSNIVISLPIFGDITKKMILVRVTRIFGFLISAGVPVVESLKIASNIAENPIYKDTLLLAADDLTKGIALSENLSDNEKLFPVMLVNMMAIGEKTASLDTVMGKASDFYNEELDRKVDNLSTLMEPVILGLIAIGAVFMILAIYLPILKMNDQVVGGF